MSPDPAPPIKFVMVVSVVTGAAALGATGKAHYGKLGMIFGILLGALAGWLAAWWVKRTFLEY